MTFQSSGRIYRSAIPFGRNDKARPLRLCASQSDRLILYFVFFASVAVKLSFLSRLLETIFLYGCHGRIEGRLKLRPVADLPVSIPHRFVSEYFLDGKQHAPAYLS